MRYLKLFYLLLFFLIFFSFFNTVYALDYKADYQVEYFLSEWANNLETTVKFNIKITNLRSDIYVKKFAVSFPKSFIIKNLKASDDYNQIIPNLLDEDNKTKIELELSKPNIGKDTVNNFYLEFIQSNLFKINGNVWEVILPVIENKENTSYNVFVHLPNNSDKKISIAKPKPSLIKENQIVWSNPKTKTIYAVFGDRQYYQLELSYHLQNSKLVPVYTDIAFPPDTLYQKIYLKSITPQPSLVYLDEDANYLGRYYLNPKEKKLVNFAATIEIFSKTRDEVRSANKHFFNNQKKYLLTEQKYWQLDDLKPIKTLNNILDIYNFVNNSLKYNYQRASKNIKRLGAKEVMLNPHQAVCTEFSDLFVAIAREKGIYSREVEGYGFSSDPELRPLSLNADVLHSWPEYYDEDKEVWIPIDPTWENTSGIDYFSSFDLNHIVFVIHGKNPDYPLPAGFYKIEESKDISIKATDLKPAEFKKIKIDDPKLPLKINDRDLYKTRLIVKNLGNVFLWSIPVEAKSDNLKLVVEQKTIDVLAPYEKKEIALEYQALNRNKKASGEITIFIGGKKVYGGKIKIFPYYYDLGLKISLIITIFLTVFFIIKMLKGMSLTKR